MSKSAAKTKQPLTREQALEALFLKTAVKEQAVKSSLAGVDTQHHLQLIANRRASGKKVEATTIAGFKKLLKEFS